MSARKVVTIRQSDFPSPTSTRAQELIQSGLIDNAASITAISHHLTGSVMATLDADYSEHDIFVADFAALRSAVWEGIASGLIEWLAKQEGPLGARSKG